jgi:hypothetical protein
MSPLFCSSSCARQYESAKLSDLIRWSGPISATIRVHASNAAGTGPASNEVTLTTGPGVCTIPETPLGLVAGVSAGTVSLAWNAPVSGAIPTGYRLDVGSAPGTSNIGSFPLPASTSLAAPAPSGTYFIRLLATNQCGNSSPSLEVSFVVP